MRVLLVRPPPLVGRGSGLPVPPLGLLGLAAVLRRGGLEVRVLDGALARYDRPGFLARVVRSGAHVLGVSVLSPLLSEARSFLEDVRGTVPRILVGGPHPSAVPDRVLDQLPQADGAFVGEAEENVVDAVRWLWEPVGDPPPGLKVRGGTFRPASLVEDLDRLPFPAWDLVPRGAYAYPLATRPGFATLVTSRGCPHGCVFCDRSVAGRRVRSRSPDSVLEELRWLQVERGVGFVAFYDDSLLHDRARAWALCEGVLGRGLDLHWKCEARVDQVDPALLALMRRAGCRMVSFGVESASDESLRRLGKGFTTAQVRRAFLQAREAGLGTLAYALLGVPGETVEDGRRTVRFCMELGADYAQFSTLTPLAGAALGEERVLCSPGPLDAEAQRAVATDLEPAELERLTRHAWRAFYGRPGVMARVVRDLARSRTGGAWAGRAVARLLQARRPTR